MLADKNYLHVGYIMLEGPQHIKTFCNFVTKCIVMIFLSIVLNVSTINEFSYIQHVLH